MLESHRSPVPARRSSEHAGLQRANLGPYLVSDSDSSGVLSGLTESIQGGHHRLDPILAAIADAALHLTGATGSAIAMWKDGAMVCRARSGETAPPLGVCLSTDSGISGACLASGAALCSSDTENDERVNAEACRTLGLRSIAVAPIVGWHGINGILEVFSTQPNAFSEEHVTLLKQLGGLAEKARALRPHSASAESKDAEQIPVLQNPGVSDRLRDVVFAAIGTRRRKFVLGISALLAALLLGSAIWLGFHSPEDADAKVSATSQPVPDLKSNPTTQLDSLLRAKEERETPISTKPPAGTPVTLASKLDRIAETRNTEPRNLSPQPASNTASSSAVLAASPQPKPAAPEAEAPSLAFEAHNTAIDNVVASASVAEPALAARVSQGISDGFLMHRVTPRYPPQALQLRMHGSVRVDAVISEEGKIESLKVIEGPPIFARAAVDAIKQWRYKPYRLDGKPVKMETTITVKFALP